MGLTLLMKTNLKLKNDIAILLMSEVSMLLSAIWVFFMKKKIQKSKILNFNFKNLGNNILDYPYVEIKWLDIEGDAGWSSTKDLKNQKLTTCVSKDIYYLNQKV